MKAKWFAAVVLILAAISVTLNVKAQSDTTYTMPASSAPFTCDASGHYPPTYFGQFQCRGIHMTSDGQTVVGSFYWINIGERVEIWLPGLAVVPGNYFDDLVTKVESFTVPIASQPGTFTFDWQELSANPDGSTTMHTGTATGTWDSKNICGGKACWYHPRLLSFSVTVSN